MWRLVKSDVNKEEATNKFPPYMEGNLVNDHTELVNLLNDYFTNVATNTSTNKSANYHIAIKNLHTVHKHTFSQILMAPVTTKEIKEIFNGKTQADMTRYL
jgi:hypothetical protein